MHYILYKSSMLQLSAKLPHIAKKVSQFFESFVGLKQALIHKNIIEHTLKEYHLVLMESLETLTFIYSEATRDLYKMFTFSNILIHV